MTDIDNRVASERILQHLREQRLVQGEWHSQDAQGRELACVLGAISPEIVSATECPASVMPQWLALIVVGMFDGQGKDDAAAWAGRFGEQMSRWHVLDGAAWDRVRAAFCAACVEDADKSAADASAAARADAAFARAAAADAADAAAAAAAVASAAAAAAANAAYWARDDGSSCWTRLANALCDAIDAELETVK